MRVGLVCPYSLDVPGGVQRHVLELAADLGRRGHQASVLAPGAAGHADDLVTPAGGSVPIPYNGSVARLAYGPVVGNRVSRWLARGDFDLLHLHEPSVPSVAMLALQRAGDIPVVGTFHASMGRSRLFRMVAPVVGRRLERLSARIAVSSEARRTHVDHLGAEVVVIPNGVDTQVFADAAPDPRFAGHPGSPSLVFLGRTDEPRKGLQVLADAYAGVLERHPAATLWVAGAGDAPAARAMLARYGHRARVLGPISEPDKAALLAAADVFVAPHLGGESFGIVLVEAMAAGVPVVAADLAAFRDVLDGGRYGRLFAPGSVGALTEALNAMLADPGAARATAAGARVAARRYDWATVTSEILDVYHLARQVHAARVA